MIVVVLEALRLVHGEDQRRLEVLSGLRLVLVAQHDDRDARRPAGLLVELDRPGKTRSRGRRTSP